MSFAYLPLFTGDYLRDTRHLSPMRHGIYLLLLMYCWDQKGPVPLDEQEAAGIANCRSSEEIEALRYILDRYFVRCEDGWYNPRIQKEIERGEAISRARSEAGRRGYEARAKHLPSKCQAIAKQVHLSPSPSPSPIHSVGDVLPKSSVVVEQRDEKRDPKPLRATRFALDALPEDWEAWCRQARPDLNPHATFERFADYWRSAPGQRGRKVDWLATWRNWCRNERPERDRPTDVMALVAQLQREGR